MYTKLIQFVFLSHICLTFAYHNPNFVQGRNGIVHLFEWKWPDIANECEKFLAPNGYAGVQVSPVQENVIIPNRPWYERYQPQSYKFHTRSGTEQEFLDMSRRCNNVGIRIYVDIVFNHMAAHQGVGIGGSVSTVEKLDYPAVPFGPGDFHKNCEIQNYTNANEVRDCRLVGLPDLDQSNEWVRQKIVEMLNNLIDMGVAGFRVDAAKHMSPRDLENIYVRMKNLNTSFGFVPKLRPYIVQEVIDLGGEGITKYEYNHLGTVTEFKFSADIGRYFRGKTPLASLKNFISDSNLLPSKDALVFVDNHDNQRGHGAGGEDILTYKQPKNYKMASAFMLAHPYGIPRVMSSFAFSNSDMGPPMGAQGELLSPIINDNGSCDSNWVCEHRWAEIVNMIKFRNAVGLASLKNWWDNGDKQIAFSRDDKGFIAFNLQPDTDMNIEIQTGLPQGTYCDIGSGQKGKDNKCTGKSINVGSNGKAQISIPKDSESGFVAIYSGVKI